jgi:antitoxin (DNA-binding transcriptional repressor) of toxin-antitoxin stability system
VSISVTEAARNFADCVNRARYQETTFVLLKSGKAVARIVPEMPKPRRGAELASALRTAMKDSHLTRDDASAWLQELDETRRGDLPRVGKWPS